MPVPRHRCSGWSGNTSSSPARNMAAAPACAAPARCISTARRCALARRRWRWWRARTSPPSRACRPIATIRCKKPGSICRCRNAAIANPGRSCRPPRCSPAIRIRAATTSFAIWMAISAAAALIRASSALSSAPPSRERDAMGKEFTGKIGRNPNGTLSRRGFLEGAAGLTFALSIPGALFVRPAAALAEGGAPAAIGAWVTIGADGAIVLAIPVAEMGQGSLTGLAMVFAEEMDADWSRVSTTYPPVKPEIFGNPIFGGQMVTYGSGSIRGYWDKVRLQAAAVRAVLMQAAADRWQVPLGELHTEPSLVVHAASNRSMSYGEIAGFAQVPATMPAIDKSALKKMADYRILGKNTPRLDIPGKIDGSALYAIDVQVPNMVYATVLRTPVEGGTPEHVDDAAALAVPGVLKVVPLKNSVGVVAETIEAAFKGRSALKVSWSSVPTDTYNSAAGLKDFLARAAKLDDKGVSYVAKGDTDDAFAKAAKVMTAQYSSEYVYHAQMEPMNVTASVGPGGDSAEIWIGTQGVSPNAFAAAAMLKTTPDKIKLNQFYLGGGYGRRSPADMLPEVLPLAQAMQRPVKLIWTREQDVKSAKMRPMTAHQIEAALDAAGKVVGWRHRVVAESIVAYVNGEKALEAAKGLDIQVLKHATLEYGIANQSIVWLREKRGVGLCSWRCIGAGYHKFAIETFIEELAAAQKVDRKSV